MTTELLLDTCAAIWVTENAPLTKETDIAMAASYHAGRPVWVSPITAWERGMLAARGRLASPMPPLTWFNRLATHARLNICEMSAEILVASSFLPDPLHRDPADRIIIATARTLDLTIVTRDRLILDYAALGHVRAIAC